MRKQNILMLAFIAILILFSVNFANAAEITDVEISNADSISTIDPIRVNAYMDGNLTSTDSYSDFYDLISLLDSLLDTDDTDHKFNLIFTVTLTKQNYGWIPDDDIGTYEFYHTVKTDSDGNKFFKFDELGSDYIPYEEFSDPDSAFRTLNNAVLSTITSEGNYYVTVSARLVLPLTIDPKAESAVSPVKHIDVVSPPQIHWSSEVQDEVTVKLLPYTSYNDIGFIIFNAGGLSPEGYVTAVTDSTKLKIAGATEAYGATVQVYDGITSKVTNVNGEQVNFDGYLIDAYGSVASEEYLGLRNLILETNTPGTYHLYWRAALDTPDTGYNFVRSPAFSLTNAPTDPLGYNAKCLTIEVVESAEPLVSITSHNDEDVVNKEDVTIYGSVSTAGELSKVEVRVNSDSWELASGTDEWEKTVSLSTGYNTIDVRATDTSGNIGEKSLSLTYSIDTTDPVVSITTPDDGSTFTYSTVSVNVDAEDNDCFGSITLSRQDGQTWVKDFYASVGPTVLGYYSWVTEIELLPGDNTIIASVTDESGNTGTDTVNLYYDYNPAPETPSLSTSDDPVHLDVEYSFRAETTDANDEQIMYVFDWGDGTQTETDFVDSGTAVTREHMWDTEGTFSVKVAAVDSSEQYSDWSSPISVTIVNHAPEVPSFSFVDETPFCPSLRYPFSASSTDEDHDQIYYIFDWGDNTQSSAGLVESGTTVTASHAWSQGTYEAKVKAVDSRGKSSDWSTSISFTIDDMYPISGFVFEGTSLSEITDIGYIDLSSRSFYGLDYDLDKDIGNERIKIFSNYVADPRTIDTNGLVYSTESQYVQSEADFGSGNLSYYSVLSMFGNKYVPLNGCNYFAELISDDDSKNMLEEGSQLDLGEGYVVTVEEINWMEDTVTMELSKDGVLIDSEALGYNDVWLYEADVPGGGNVPVFKLLSTGWYMSETGFVAIIEGIWLVDFDNIQTISNGDTFGLLEVTDVGSNYIDMKNPNSIVLSAGSEQEIIPGILIETADSSDVRFRFKPSDECELRGSVAGTTIDGDILISEWNYTNYPGFYFDFDENVALESLKIYSDLSDSDRTIEEDFLVYDTNICEKSYAFAAWSSEQYDFTSLFSEPYVVFRTAEVDWFAKLIIDSDDLLVLTVDSPLYLGDGYEVVVRDILSTKAIDLMRYGKTIDIVSVSSGSNEYSIDVEGDLKPFFKVNVADMGAEHISVNGLWLVDSEDIFTIDDFEDFDATITDNQITLINDQSITLSRDSFVALNNQFGFKVADDSDYLRYYPVLQNSIINSITPESDAIECSQGDTLSFVVGSEQLVSYQWFLDGNLVKTDSWYYSTYETPELEVGVHKVKVNAESSTSTEENTWIIEVQDSYVGPGADVSSVVYSGLDLPDIVNNYGIDIYDDFYGSVKCLEFNKSNFDGFFYDSEADLSTEELRIYDERYYENSLNGRTIPEDLLEYRTTIQMKNFNASCFNDFYNEYDQYPVMGLFGEKYVPLNSYTPDLLAELVLDSDEVITLSSGESVDLGDGFALKLSQMDSEGYMAWLQLYRFDELVDEEIIACYNPEGTTWWYDRDVASQDDTIVFGAHISGSSSSSVTIDGLWLIDYENLLKMETDDEFGNLKVVSIGSDNLVMANTIPLVLASGTSVELAEGFFFEVADNSDILSFQLVRTIDDGTVPNSLPTATIVSISPNPTTYGETISFEGTGSDTDGNVVAYNWRSDVDGQLSTSQSFSLSDLSIGTHTIYFKVKDDSGEWSTEVNFELVVEAPNSIPLAGIISVSPNPVKVGKSVTFLGSGIDFDGSVVAYEWTSSIDGYIGNSAGLSTSSLSVGDHTISFRVQDDDGSWSDFVYEDLQILENSIPTAAIISIPDVSVVGESITFSGEGTDIDGSVVDYNWRSSINGQLSTNLSFSTSLLSAGEHTIYFMVQDSDGAWSSEVSENIIVDDGNPFVDIYAGFDSNISVNNPVNITFNTSDMYPGTTEFTIINNTGIVVLTQNVTEAITPGEYTFIWNTTGQSGEVLPGGVYVLNLTSTDAFGHSSSSEITVVVDNTAPTISIENIEGSSTQGNLVYANSDLVVNVSASSDVNYLECILSSVSTSYSTSIFAEFIDGKWVATFDLSSLDEGNYELTVNANDEAKNTNSSVSELQVVVDHTSPVFMSTTSQHNETYRKVSVTASESVTGYPVVEVNSELINLTLESGKWIGYFSIDADSLFTVNVTGTDLAGNIGDSTSLIQIKTITYENGQSKFNSSESDISITFNGTNGTTGTMIVTESEDPMVNLTNGSIGLYFLDVELDDILAGNMSGAMIAIAVDSLVLPDGMDKEDVSICYYNESAENWESCPTSIEMIDGVECWTTYVTHFSMYGVIARDTVVPVLESVTPASGSEFTKDTTSVDIRFNYSDAQTGIDVSSIVFEFDGNIVNDASLEITGSYASYTATNLSSGSYTASITVADMAGNSVVFSTTFTIASDSVTSSGGSSGSSGGGGGGGSTSGEAYENILVKDVLSIFINKDSHISYEFTKEGDAITSVQFDSLKNSGKIQTIIEVLKDRSAFADVDAPGTIYQQMNIWVGKSGFVTAENVENLLITFKVEKSWLEENNIEAGTVYLYRYADGSWNALPTSITEEDDDFVYLESQTPGFSPFAIGSETEVIETVEEDAQESVIDESEEKTAIETEPESSSSTGILALLGGVSVLLVGAYVVYNKRS